MLYIKDAEFALHAWGIIWPWMYLLGKIALKVLIHTI